MVSGIRARLLEHAWGAAPIQRRLENPGREPTGGGCGVESTFFPPVGLLLEGPWGP